MLYGKSCKDRDDVDCSLVVRDQILMPNFVQSSYLIYYQFRVPISLKVVYSQMSSELELDNAGVVLDDIISAWFHKVICTVDNQAFGG